MVRSYTYQNADKTLINNSNIFIPISPIFNAFTLAPARIPVPVKTFILV